MILHKSVVFTRRRRLAVGVILFLVFCWTVFYGVLIPNLFFMSWGLSEDISCYYSEISELPSADFMFSPSSKSIFFHETSCTGNLTSRQSCAIESAARAHPDFQIIVLFSAPMTEAALNGPIVKRLIAFDNIRFRRLHINRYVKGTPVEEFVTSGALNRTHWRISHTSDVLRFLSLLKWGGVYLDMDVVVAKSFDSLAKNWAARESNTIVATGALSFSMDEIGRSIVEAVVREVQTTFRGDVWGHNGPGAITRVLKKMCSTSNVTHMSAATCGGFEVYGPELFYPIEWKHGAEYFKPGELRNKDAYVYHVWNHLTNRYKVDENSPYAELARRFCPLTYNLYGDRFGT